MERIPASLEVSSMIRRVQAAGGFGTVLHKGEPDAGTILVVLMENGVGSRLYERMPTLEGHREWMLTRAESVENKQEFQEYLDRRVRQDRDTWIIELDIVNGERFIGDS